MEGGDGGAFSTAGRLVAYVGHAPETRNSDSSHSRWRAPQAADRRPRSGGSCRRRRGAERSGTSQALASCTSRATTFAHGARPGVPASRPTLARQGPTADRFGGTRRVLAAAYRGGVHRRRPRRSHRSRRPRLGPVAAAVPCCSTQAAEERAALGSGLCPTHLSEAAPPRFRTRTASFRSWPHVPVRLGVEHRPESWTCCPYLEYSSSVRWAAARLL
ncbi:hypothetical protein ACFZCF_17335 [Streptomyces sp. NPDC007945]|uniref:hypothetical protein n=1 Tax=Streptomyces sp. NPDC007945 TaxID=3364797 RepID=UPI0036EC14CC